MHDSNIHTPLVAAIFSFAVTVIISSLSTLHSGSKTSNRVVAAKLQTMVATVASVCEIALKLWVGLGWEIQCAVYWHLHFIACPAETLAHASLF